jgi:tetratricopeptide (TPR) repeat protein
LSTHDERASRARSQYERAVELTEAGDPAAALEASTFATELYRLLASTDPERYLPELLRSLQNRAWICVCLHRMDHYLATSADAVLVCRSLAARRPNEFKAVLATELNNVSLTLIDKGHTDAAVASIHEAVEIERDLLRTLPDDEDARWRLAVTLSNLSRILAHAAEHSGALQAADEYATLTRELARSNPQRFGNALALSLTVLASRLSGVGRFQDALTTVMEAVKFHRERQASESYYPAGSLAEALNELSVALLGVHRPREALSASEEATGYLTELEARMGTYASQLERARQQSARIRQALETG